jgi:hypothetical protein
VTKVTLIYKKADDHMKVIMPALTVGLCGGLGNQMFKMAALLHVAKRTRRTPYIQTIENPSPHSKESYFDTIFQSFDHLYSTVRPSVRIPEPSMSYANWSKLLEYHVNPEMDGYFQDYRYVDEDFIQKLRFPVSIVKKYPGVYDAVFLHIRGGDYVGNSFHDLGLDNYYRRAIAHFPDAHFYVVTNDLGYALSRPFLEGIKFTIIMEPELDTLFLMSQCAGGICANSSFSWWGAFLNPHRKIVMPDRWYGDSSLATEGYYFPGVIKCPVS